MVHIDIDYGGDLHCRARHGPSGATLETDAPVDNQGKGEAFSPTDLLATSLGVCMMTVMGIHARREGIDLRGAKVEVIKEMVNDPDRRVGKLTVTLRLPGSVPRQQRPALEAAGLGCPVCRSLDPGVRRNITFLYGEPENA